MRILFEKGDAVAYRTKDIHGYQYIAGVVKDVTRGSGYHIELPSGTSVVIPGSALTLIKTVWADTLKEVIP